MKTVKKNYKGCIADRGTTRGCNWKTQLYSFRTTANRKLTYKNQIIMDY